MNIFFYFKNKRGLTLIELIVALAILSIVLAMAFNFFFYGMNVFKLGGIKSDIQQDLNQAAYFITNKIRNVENVSVTSKAGYSTLDIQGRHPNINEVEYKIIQVGGSYYLEFVLTRDEHTIESRVILNNVKGATEGFASNLWYKQ